MLYTFSVYDPLSYECYLISDNNLRPEQDSNPDLCNVSAVLYQLSYQANWELVVMWGDNKPIDDIYIYIYIYICCGLNLSLV